MRELGHNQKDGIKGWNERADGSKGGWIQGLKGGLKERLERMEWN